MMQTYTKNVISVWVRRLMLVRNWWHWCWCPDWERWVVTLYCRTVAGKGDATWWVLSFCKVLFLFAKVRNKKQHEFYELESFG